MPLLIYVVLKKGALVIVCLKCIVNIVSHVAIHVNMLVSIHKRAEEDKIQE